MNNTKTMTRKHFLGLTALGAVGLAACGSDDGTDDAGADTGNDTGSSGGDDSTVTNPSSPTSVTDDESDDTVDPSAGSSEGPDPTAESTGPDPTADGSTTDPSESSGPGDESTTGTPAGCESDPTAEFDLHIHTLTIPVADVVAGVEQTYVAGGGHTHDVTVTAENFAELLAGNEVIVSAAPGGASEHPHQVTLICR